MKIEDEIRLRKEKIRKEVLDLENPNGISESARSSMKRYGMSANPPVIISTSGELKQLLVEARPYINFTNPKVIVAMSDGKKRVRTAHEQDEAEKKSFDILLYSNGSGNWASSYYMWVFSDGSVALANNGRYNLTWSDIYKKGIDEASIRSRVIDAIALQELEKEPAAASSSQSSGGCYIATAVYGSYDCPKVWILRRYRDFCLKKTLCGRVFIRVYYAVSPLLVRWFGESAWFKRLWRKILDRKVELLKQCGYSDFPYSD